MAFFTDTPLIRTRMSSGGLVVAHPLVRHPRQCSLWGKGKPAGFRVSLAVIVGARLERRSVYS
jgi:hypothetical protein